MRIHYINGYVVNWLDHICILYITRNGYSGFIPGHALPPSVLGFDIHSSFGFTVVFFFLLFSARCMSVSFFFFFFPFLLSFPISAVLLVIYVTAC